MSGNASLWCEEDGIQYFGVDSEAWLGKLEPDGDKFRWTYGFFEGFALTGKVAEEDTGREIIETFQQALDLAEDFSVLDLSLKE